MTVEFEMYSRMEIIEPDGTRRTVSVKWDIESMSPILGSFGPVWSLPAIPLYQAPEPGYEYWAGGVGTHCWEADKDMVPQV
jgi:hypothetical protein